MVQCCRISLETLNIHHQDIEMITSETPYKLVEIIRNTWPNLYRPQKIVYNEKKKNQDEQVSE